MSESNAEINIIELSKFKFPVGSEVWHSKYRLCTVVGSNGSQRKIRTPNTGQKEFAMQYIDVHVNELRELILPDELKHDVNAD